MRVFQIQIVFTTNDETQEEEDIRQRIEDLLDGSGFGVAEVVRDEEQEQEE